jgi:hypothetical protein
MRIGYIQVQSSEKSGKKIGLQNHQENDAMCNPENEDHKENPNI